MTVSNRLMSWKAQVRKLEEEKETLQNEVQIAVCTFDLVVHVFM